MDIEQKIEKFDEGIIHIMKRLAFPFARFALFVVYFWFGILKVFSLSPANPLVAALLAKILPGVPFPSFIIALGVVEIFIAFLFIIKGMERIALFVLALHMIMVIMPLIAIPAVTWQSFMVPTLEGQYIIKNILIIALGMSVIAHLNPIHAHKK